MLPTAARQSPLRVVILLTIVLLQTEVVCVAEESSDTSRQTSASIKLPPRSGNKDTSSTPQRKSASTSAGLWTTAASLTVIVGVLGALTYWLRPYLGPTRSLPIDAFELLGRRSLEQKVAIHLVRCGERVLLLSVSSEGARTLSEITDPTEVRKLVDACHAPRDGKSFVAETVTPPPAAQSFLSPLTSSARTSTHRTPLPGEDLRRG